VNAQGPEQIDQPSGAASTLAPTHPGVLALLDNVGSALAIIPMPRIGAEPPTEFRAFVFGDNPTTKGMLKLTKDGATKAMATFKARGVAKCFDLWHSTYAPQGTVRPQDRFAVGHFSLDLRDDGMWFTDIQWVPQYAQEIREGKWPFISPAVVHTKAGEIFEFNNAGLVTDPGLIGVRPTILSNEAAGSEEVKPEPGTPAKRKPMADNKRMVMDAYAACEMAMKRCQSLADTDGADKEMGNRAIGMMAPMMDMMKAHMGGAGMMDAAMMSATQLEAGQTLLATLSAEHGQTDPVKLGAILAAKIDGHAPPAPVKGVLLSDSDAALVVTTLDALGHDRIPAARRASLKAAGPAALATYLSAATPAAPVTAALNEAPPLAPTSANLSAVSETKPMPDAAKPADAKPTTLAACTKQQRAFVTGHLDMARQLQGDNFNEAHETDMALTMLSDIKPNTTDRIRMLPHGADGPTEVYTGEV
jgi:hypothetical protein